MKIYFFNFHIDQIKVWPEIKIIASLTNPLLLSLSWQLFQDYP
jgi:hypothetical protein